MALPLDTPDAFEPSSLDDPALRVHRIVYRRGTHAWRLAFTRPDAATLANRLDELASDPESALDEIDARALRAQIARLRGASAPPASHSPVPDHSP